MGAVAVRQCWRCKGSGWVRNGEPEDGRMTGRDYCPVCNGQGWVTEERVLTEIRRLATLPDFGEMP